MHYKVPQVVGYKSHNVVWYQLDNMLIICTSLQTDNHAITSALNFFTGRMFF